MFVVFNRGQGADRGTIRGQESGTLRSILFFGWWCACLRMTPCVYRITNSILEKKIHIWYTVMKSLVARSLVFRELRTLMPGSCLLGFFGFLYRMLGLNFLFIKV